MEPGTLLFFFFFFFAILIRRLGSAYIMVGPILIGFVSNETELSCLNSEPF